ncbi:MAG: ComEC/Rec2 family competence protein [bacterium]|nr:ComEC/Rec2 family competence protein [bacterium]
MELGLVATFFGGLLSGIFFRSFIDLGVSFAIFLALLSITLFFTWKLSSQVGSRRGVFVPVFLFALALGILRFDIADTRDILVILERLDGQVIKIEGVMIDEPKEKDKNTTLIVEAIIEGQHFNILVLTKPYFKYNYGDKISIFGRLEEVKNFTEDFDYVAYLAKDEIYYQFLNPKISLISKGNGTYLQEKLFEFKNSFLENINLVISEPEASLMGGLILGAKSSLDKDLTNDFKRAGLIHIVALSGYNVTVVADNLMRLIWFLPLVARLLVGTIAITLFALMTGGGSTVVRASLMVLLAMLARATGRIYLVGSALLVAATLMILYDPKILVFDISFQLSFLATAGLIFFTPILEKYLKFITDRFYLREMLVSTLSAQLAVWPFILYKMGNFSLVSIPANLLVGPVVPYTMFLGFVTGLAGYISYYLSLLFSPIAYFLLLYIVKVTEFFSSLSFASIIIAFFPLSLTIIIYVAYLITVLLIDTER